VKIRTCVPLEMMQRENTMLTAVEKAYLAGLIDGEEYVDIKVKTAQVGTPNYSLR
jgi:hypothetical protein